MPGDAGLLSQRLLNRPPRRFLQGHYPAWLPSDVHMLRDDSCDRSPSLRYRYMYLSVTLSNSASA
jgi:hypothetical protein